MRLARFAIHNSPPNAFERRFLPFRFVSRQVDVCTEQFAKEATQGIHLASRWIPATDE
jgi:hypothetical protein